MRFFEINEIWDWCAKVGIALIKDAPPADDDAHVERARWLYADGERSGREPGLARTAVAQLGGWDEVLLWITQTGVWASGENWPAYYAL